MKAITVDLGKDCKGISIHLFADWHIGDVNCDKDAIKAAIKAVEEDPNAYVICMGDLMNNATKASVSDLYSEEIPPMKQLETLHDLLFPVKDRILMLLQGNHEARTMRGDGIDLTGVLAVQLGIPDRYAREGGLLYLVLGTTHSGRNMGGSTRTVYSIYATHGTGGGRKEGAKAIRLADMAAIIDADIYCHAHTHLPMVMKQSFFRALRPKRTFEVVDKLFVNASAKLDYGGYGQAGEYKPSSKASPVIHLDGHKRNMTARL